MASFTQDVNFDRTPQFLNYSQGVRDNSAASLVSGLTETLDSKLKSTDRALSQMAQDEVRNTVNETDASLLGVGPSVPSKDPLEREVKTQVRNLDRQRKAMDAGTISPDYYYSTVQAKVKEIRGRYAGYNDVIDNELKSMGIDPNWQRQQIMAEAQAGKNRAANAAAEADKNNREFLERAITAIPLPADLRARAIQPGAHQDPDLMKRIKLQTNAWVSMKGSMEADKMEAELLDAKDSRKATSLGTSYNRELQTGIYNAVMSSVDWKQFQESSRKVQEQVNAGQAASPADQEQLRASFAAVRSRMQDLKLSVKAGYTDSAVLFTKEMAQADKLFDETLDGFEKGLSDPSTGLLGYNIAAIEGRVKGKQFDLVKNSEMIAGQAASRALLGDVAFADYIKTTGDQALEPLRADVQNNLLIDQTTKKNQSLISGIRKIVSDPKNNDPKVVADAVDNTVNLFLNPNTRQEGKKVLAGVLFHKDNKEFFDQLLSSNIGDNQKRDYITKFASPAMYQEVKKLNDPVALNKYIDTVSYASARLNRETANQIQDIKEFASFKDITFNSASNRLEVKDREPGGSTPNAKAVNQFFSYLKAGDDTAQNAVDNVNKTLEIMTPIWRDQGVDINQASRAFIGSLGINPDAPKQGNILERGIDFLKNPQDYIGGSQGKDKAGGGAGEDNLQNFRLAPKPGDVNPDQVRAIPAVLSGRVEDYLVSKGVGKDAASTLGKAFGGLTGVDSVQMAIDSGDPIKIAQESALAALTLIPGAALERTAPALTADALKVIEGGGKKAVEAAKGMMTRTTLTPDDLAKGETLASKAFSGDTTSLTQDALALAREGPLTSERWDAIAAAAKVDINKNIVNLNDVKASREAMKVANDIDAEASSYLLKLNNTYSKSIDTVVKKGNTVMKDLQRLYNVAQDTGNVEIAQHIADFVKLQDVYGKAAAQTSKYFDTVSAFPSNRAARKAYERSYQTQKMFEDQLSSIVDDIASFRDKIKPTRVK